MRVVAVFAVAASLALAGCGVGPFASQPETETPPPAVAVEPVPTGDQTPDGTPESSAAELAAIEEAEFAAEALPSYAQDENGLTLSKQFIKWEWLEPIKSGEKTLESAKAEIRQMAAEAYPAFAEDLAAGQTLQQAAQPYADLVGEAMGYVNGVAPLDDPVLLRVLSYRDESGNAMKPRVWQVERIIRSSPEWRSTPEAQRWILEQAERFARM